MAFVKTWDETKPAGSRAKSLGDDDIREFKYAIRERLDVDHYAYDDESGMTDTGYHKIIHLMVQTAITELADAGCLYTKDVSAKAELHFKDEDANEIQLTEAGNLKLPATVVLLTGAQSIDGVKTFTSFPVTPSSAPTTDYQVSNKKYVDDQVAAVPAHAFGSWTDKSADYGAQEATTDLFVVARIGYNAAKGITSLTGYTDANADPTTVRACAQTMHVDDQENSDIQSFTMPVKKGDYWKCVVSGTANQDYLSVYTLAVGS